MKAGKKSQRKLENRLRAHAETIARLSRNPKFNPKSWRAPGSRNRHQG